MNSRPPLDAEILTLVKTAKTGIRFNAIYAQTTIAGEQCEHDRNVDTSLQHLRRAGKIHMGRRNVGWLPGPDRAAAAKGLQGGPK